MHTLSELFLRRSDRLMQKHELPCVHIDELLGAVGLGGGVDILVVDTEGFDYELLAALNLTLVRPLAIEFEAKAFTYEQCARRRPAPHTRALCPENSASGLA